uniref:Bestrophin homolog n=1 Tax=Eutreptiella gymnastica TaxID=73025 RepID=A0A7S1J5T7_9EUGL|mmetsp:Transcript_68844/g.121594  ORF Transcript_68844/g.121594 Transcript_68844/m.121594 type:complete len:491 (+) Transcript_68844:54-1526(+)
MMTTTPACVPGSTEHRRGAMSFLPSVGIVLMLGSLGALATLPRSGPQDNVALWASATSTAHTPLRGVVPDRTQVIRGGLATPSYLSTRPVLPTTVSVSTGDANEWPQAQLPSFGEDHVQEPDTLITRLLSIPMLAGALMYLWRDKRADKRVAMAAAASYVDRGLGPKDRSRDAKAETYRGSPTRRTVFFYNDWRKARSSWRLFRAIWTMPRSQVAWAALREVFFISLVSAFACALHVYGVPYSHLHMSAFSLSAPSLSLLLVFRTNSCYVRWDDARRILGASLNRSRDVARQAIGWFPKDDKGTVLRERMCRYMQSWPYVLKCHLRGGPGGCENDDNIREDLAGILTPAEIDLLLKSGHRPMHVLQCMTEIAREAKLPIPAQMNVDYNMAAFSDVVGGCERILRTPIPLSYNRMTARFLIIWLLGLPFALSLEIVKAGLSVWMTVPVVAFVSFLLLGIEELATQLEEPFSILPMGPYANTCKTNIDGLAV